MRKRALTVLGALLIAGSAVQAASASERHLRKAHRAPALVQDEWDFRQAYAGPFYYVPEGLQAVRERNRQNSGFGGWDPSRPGDFDPSLRPSETAEIIRIRQPGRIRAELIAATSSAHSRAARRCCALRRVATNRLRVGMPHQGMKQKHLCIVSEHIFRRNFAYSGNAKWDCLDRTRGSGG